MCSEKFNSLFQCVEDSLHLCLDVEQFFQAREVKLDQANNIF